MKAVKAVILLLMCSCSWICRAATIQLREEEHRTMLDDRKKFTVAPVGGALSLFNQSASNGEASAAADILYVLLADNSINAVNVSERWSAAVCRINTHAPASAIVKLRATEDGRYLLVTYGSVLTIYNSSCGYEFGSGVAYGKLERVIGRKFYIAWGGSISVTEIPSGVPQPMHIWNYQDGNFVSDIMNNELENRDHVIYHTGQVGPGLVSLTLWDIRTNSQLTHFSHVHLHGRYLGFDSQFYYYSNVSAEVPAQGGGGYTTRLEELLMYSRNTNELTHTVRHNFTKIGRTSGGQTVAPAVSQDGNSVTFIHADEDCIMLSMKHVDIATGTVLKTQAIGSSKLAVSHGKIVSFSNGRFLGFSYPGAELVFNQSSQLSGFLLSEPQLLGDDSGLVLCHNYKAVAEVRSITGNGELVFNQTFVPPSRHHVTALSSTVFRGNMSSQEFVLIHGNKGNLYRWRD